MTKTTKRLDGVSTGFGGNDDYPPPPTMTTPITSITTKANDNNNSIFIFKKLVPLNCFDAYTITTSLFSSSQPLPYLRSPSIPLPWHILNLGLHLSVSFLDFLLFGRPVWAFSQWLMRSRQADPIFVELIYPPFFHPLIAICLIWFVPQFGILFLWE